MTPDQLAFSVLVRDPLAPVVAVFTYSLRVVLREAEFDEGSSGREPEAEP